MHICFYIVIVLHEHIKLQENIIMPVIVMEQKDRRVVTVPQLFAEQRTEVH